MKQHTVVLFAVLLLLGPAVLADGSSVGEIEWINDFRFYGDDTEFRHSPYRDGETILGGQLLSFLQIPIGERITILAGGFVDVRSGAEDQPTDSLPLLSFRYGVDRTRFIIGTLETVRRHGLIDPLQISTLELTRPVESGVQFLSGGRRWAVDGFVNWQRLITPDQREAFDYGIVGHYSLGRGFSVEGQGHGYHEGGQLYDLGSVYNNVVFAGGAGWERDFGALGTTSVRAMVILSRTTQDPLAPDRPTEGDGLWARVSVNPWSPVEIWGIYWKGEDFFSFEGDPNYGSVGSDPDFYQASRRYKELGAIYSFPTPSKILFTVEGRLHWIDDELEASFRLYARVPIRFVVWRPRG